MIKKCLHACTPSQLGAIIIGLCLWNTAIAQNGASEVYNEQLRVLLDQKSPSSQRTTFDAGGWTNLGYFDYIDSRALVRRKLLQLQFRAWGSVNVKDTHEFYIRGLYNHDNWFNNSNPPAAGEYHGRGTLERGYYRWNAGNTFGWDPDGALKLQIKAGRDYQALGSAFVLSLPIDMVHARFMYKDWDFKTFIGKTIRRTPNIDQSPAAYHQNNRLLVGGEVSYEGMTNHRPYALVLFNWDHSDPLVRTTNDSTATAQAHKYDTQHYGIGSRGTLYSDNLLYQAEFVAQRGRTYANASTTTRDDIEAYGLDALVEYFMHVKTEPKIMAEYMYGSGDPDKTSSNSVATWGGNTANTRDYRFNTFGYRDTGIAFAPAVSNLHILVTGVSLFPMEPRPWFDRFEVGSKLFGYWKDRNGGSISDTNGASDASYVGFEYDIFLNWRLTSDLACTARFGHFKPGKAFNGGDRSPREYFYTGAVFSF